MQVSFPEIILRNIEIYFDLINIMCLSVYGMI